MNCYDQDESERAVLYCKNNPNSTYHTYFLFLQRRRDAKAS